MPTINPHGPANAPSPVGAATEEYLTISEVAARLKITPKTL
jgi:hypothetical protein